MCSTSALSVCTSFSGNKHLKSNMEEGELSSDEFEAVSEEDITIDPGDAKEKDDREEIETIIENASYMWCSAMARRDGQGKI